MSRSATDDLSFVPPVSLPLAVDFPGGRLTNDGGWCRVAAANADLGLSETLSLAVHHGRS